MTATKWPKSDVSLHHKMSPINNRCVVILLVMKNKGCSRVRNDLFNLCHCFLETRARLVKVKVSTQTHTVIITTGASPFPRPPAPRGPPSSPRVGVWVRRGRTSSGGTPSWTGSSTPCLGSAVGCRTGTSCGRGFLQGGEGRGQWTANR